MLGEQTAWLMTQYSSCAEDLFGIVWDRDIVWYVFALFFNARTRNTNPTSCNAVAILER